MCLWYAVPTNLSCGTDVLRDDCTFTFIHSVRKVALHFRLWCVDLVVGIEVAGKVCNCLIQILHIPQQLATQDVS
jgi:hypothetical protein